jgi:putative ABC transport system permease protein
VLLFALAMSCVAAVLAGLAPAWQAARADLVPTLKGGGRAMAAGHPLLRRALVVAEFALALTLLTGGVLTLESFVRLARVDLGLRTERLLAFSLPVGEGRLVEPEEINAFYRSLLDRVQAAHGVTSASVSTGVPLRWMGETDFSVAGEPADTKTRASFNRVSSDYFATFGIRLTRGRAFDARDHEGAAPVAIVNEAFVKRYLGGGDPFARTLAVEEPFAGRASARVERQIVGVAADVRSGGPQLDPSPTIHVPFWQSPRPQAAMAVRTEAEPALVQAALVAAVQSLDPDLPLGNPKTMDQVVSERMAADRFNTVLFAGFAAAALVLATVGIYGLMAFGVAQRTREIGLRMALGASRSDVVGQVLREGMTTAAAGGILGSAGAYWVAQAMRGLLPAVGTANAWAFAAVAVVLLAAAFFACLVPARRAVSVDPMVVLRQD